MPTLSRKKRKRNRRRSEVEAIARGPTPRGWGAGLETKRSDVAILRKAVRERWHVRSEVKIAVVCDILRAFDSQSPRMLASLAMSVVSMESHNRRVELSAMPRDESFYPTRSGRNQLLID